MSNKLHNDLETLLGFFLKQRKEPPAAFAYQPGLVTDPGFFSVEKFQQFINNPLLTPAWVHVISRGKSVELQEACLFKEVQGNQLGFINKDFINHHLENGAAVVLEGVDILDSSINDFLAGVEQALPCSLCNCVAMFSQSGNEAYEGHLDSDDVLVIQISGEKLWHIYEPQQRRFADTTHMNKQQLGPEIKQLTLKPGDAMYVRAGVPHRCDTPGDHSLHLAFDLIDSTPNVSQITAEANRLYDYACEEPYAPPAKVMERYTRLIQSADFQDSLRAATESMKNDARVFRQLIGRSTGVNALGKYF